MKFFLWSLLRDMLCTIMAGVYAYHWAREEGFKAPDLLTVIVVLGFVMFIDFWPPDNSSSR